MNKVKDWNVDEWKTWPREEVHYRGGPFDGRKFETYCHARRIEWPSECLAFNVPAGGPDAVYARGHEGEDFVYIPPE